MCDTCGCGTPSVRTIHISQRLLDSNAAQAKHNREHFAERGVFAVNLMGAPGAGKTALLESTLGEWRGSGRVAVIEGDPATERDSLRVRAAGAIAFQVETGLGCHLDARQIHRAFHQMELARGDLLFIENVGNLVCPAMFDLGEQLRVVVTSPVEGIDKPLKYPPMFRAADIVVLNKCDLLAHVSFDVEEWKGCVAAANPHARIVLTSASRRTGIDAWLGEIEASRRAFFGQERK